MRHSTTEPNVFGDLRQEVHSAPVAAMSCVWSRTSVLKEVWDVVLEVGTWPGVAITTDLSGLCFTFSGALLGHLRWSGRIDLPFAPDIRDRLVAEEMASLDPDQPDACRVVFVVRTLAGVDRAIWLLRLAYLNVNSNLHPHANEFAQPGRGRLFRAHGGL